jgi:DDE superfamily endonuclease/Helix-turn-helix of DDE superfamily endonuclease
MITYPELRQDRRRFLALTGLTLKEFDLLLAAFRRSYDRLHPADQTLTGRPRQRLAGGGRRGVLHLPEQKLLFLLVYLKAYPLQALMGELFDLSQQGVNYWLHRLLPILQSALDDLGVLPGRCPSRFPQSQPASEKDRRLIIDATERRRQRPKNPEKQALHYSGKKKTHTDKNVVIVNVPNRRVEFLSQTYAGKTHEKTIADQEGITYPPNTVLYKDTGFQGYEPPVKETCQPKKKGARKRTDTRGAANQSKAGEDTGQSRTWAGRGEKGPDRQRHLPEHHRR